MEPLEFPKEFLGATKKSGGYTDSEPRAWTDNEVSWILDKKQNGYSVQDIAVATERTVTSVSIKLKRLSKLSDTYNEPNRDLKYSTNTFFVNFINPKSVLDVYAGNSWYKNVGLDRLVTNDSSGDFETDYQVDALALLCQMYLNNEKFDVIDLDPYGSAFDCFDLAIKLSTKGIVVSFGEWGHKRWKRTDFVGKRYSIPDMASFTEDAFINEFIRVAARNKKKAVPIRSIKYGNFLRVYFKLEKLLTTDQWDLAGAGADDNLGNTIF